MKNLTQPKELALHRGQMIYLGPYFVLSTTFKSATKDNCKNISKCKNQKEGNFCEECGIKITDRFEHKRNFIYVSDYIDDALYDFRSYNRQLMNLLTNDEQNQFIWLIPNHNRNPPRTFIISDTCYELEISSENIKDEISWLEESFEKEIMILKNHNCKFIKTTWGLLLE